MGIGHARIIYPVDLTNEGWLLEDDSSGSFASVSSADFGIGFSSALFIQHPTLARAVFSYLEDTWNAASSNNVYSIEPIPNDPFGRDDFRVRISRVAGSDSFRVSRKGSGDQFMLYMGADSATDTLTDSSGVITFPNSFIGQWLAGPYKHIHWHDERTYPKAVTSVARTNSDQVYITSRTKKNCREYKFLAVPGVLAAEDRANYESLANQFGVQWLKENYASFEAFWENAILLGNDWYYYTDVAPETFNAYGYRRITSRVVERSYIDDPRQMMTDRVQDFGTDYYDILLQALDIGQQDPDVYYIDTARGMYSLTSYYGFGRGDSEGTTVTDSEGANNGTYAAPYIANSSLVQNEDPDADETGSVNLNEEKGSLGTSTDWDFIHVLGVFTLNFWLNVGSATSGVVLANAMESSTKGIKLSLSSADGQTYLDVIFEGNSQATMQLPVPGQAAHVGIIGNGNFMIGMVDGVVKDSSAIATTLAVSSHTLQFGREADTTAAAPNAPCYLDELGIDNAAWRVEDVRRVYYAGR